MRWPASVTVCEVGPRDGFQMEPSFIPTPTKIAIIDLLSRTGLREIQATSFVRPTAVPQMRDAEEVMAGLRREHGVLYAGLVPNERGAERAIAAGCDRLDVVVSATDSHSLSNTRMPTRRALERVGRIVPMARAAGRDVAIGIAVALGCPFEGVPPYARVEALVGHAVEELGLTRVSLADTVGMANPRQVSTTVAALRARFPQVAFGLHLHNTRGMALANALAGLAGGVTHLDASVAGPGGWKRWWGTPPRRCSGRACRAASRWPSTPRAPPVPDRVLRYGRAGPARAWRSLGQGRGGRPALAVGERIRPEGSRPCPAPAGTGSLRARA